MQLKTNWIYVEESGGDLFAKIVTICKPGTINKNKKKIEPKVSVISTVIRCRDNHTFTTFGTDGA